MATRRLKKRVKKKKKPKAISKTVEKKVSKVVLLKAAKKMPQVALPLSLPIDQLLGNYSNRAVISHTEHEFIFDFLLTLAHESLLASRVITSPQHAKRVFEALGTNIKRYEETFEKIKSE